MLLEAIVAVLVIVMMAINSDTRKTIGSMIAVAVVVIGGIVMVGSGVTDFYIYICKKGQNCSCTMICRILCIEGVNSAP